MKMNISDLVIEVTRKCNLECEHCLRGTSQDVTISYETIKNIFSQLDSIGTVTFTGGEPLLCPEAIKQCIEAAKRYNVPIENFYIATNGTVSTPEAFIAIAELYAYCSSNEVSSLCISKDQYHAADYEDAEKLFSAFTFYHPEERTAEIHKVISEGFAEEWGDREEDALPALYETDDIVENGYYGDDALHVSAMGEICLSCNLSYKTQKEKNIGNVNSTTLYAALSAYAKSVQREEE